jgi:hypothetical protein
MPPSEQLTETIAQLRRDAADYAERSKRAAASGSAVATREWLEASIAASKAAREIEADRGA